MRRSLIVAALLLVVTPAYSVDFTCSPGNVACLISAIQVANSNGQYNDIFLERGTYTLTAVDNNTAGFNGLPSITGRMRIHGPDGSGSTIERADAAPHFRLFQVAAGGNLTLDWLGLRGGFIDTGDDGSHRGGGAIFNLGVMTIHRCAIYNHRAEFLNPGGAIENLGSLTITFTNIRDSVSTAGQGGGIYSLGGLVIEDSSVTNNSTDFGGGLNVGGSGGTSIIRTTIANNIAQFGGGIFGGNFFIENSSVHHNFGGRGGGGIRHAGGFGPSATATSTIISSTISDNRVDGFGSPGGGILNDGSLLLRNVTISANLATADASIGGIYNQSGIVRLQNTIVALNTRTRTNSAGTTIVPSDCNSVSSLGNNLIGDLSGCTVALIPTDQLGDPGLGSFTEFTDPLLEGSGHYPLFSHSPAVDAGNPLACTPRDQLGERRAGTCDIGAVERWKP